MHSAKDIIFFIFIFIVKTSFVTIEFFLKWYSREQNKNQMSSLSSDCAMFGGL